MHLKHVFFYADASPTIGAGHVMRCRTIALALQKRFDGHICFVSSAMPTALGANLKASGFDQILLSDPSIPPCDALASVIEDHDQSALVIDSYSPEFYQLGFQQRIMTSAARFVMIAFDEDAHYICHVLHNQNPRSREIEFSSETYTKRLFGLQHVILDERIRESAGNVKPIIPRDENWVALLTFGGSDPHNHTTRTIEAIKPYGSRFKKIIVVIGSMFPHKTSLENAIKDCRVPVEILSNISNMPDVIKSCDVAISSGGLTTWELGALGKPVIILPSGQREEVSARFLEKMQFAQCVYSPQNITIEELGSKIASKLRPEMFEMANRLRSEINPDGVETLVDAILE